MHALALCTREITELVLLKVYHYRGSFSTVEETDKMRKRLLTQKDELPIVLLLKSMDHGRIFGIRLVF